MNEAISDYSSAISREKIIKSTSRMAVEPRVGIAKRKSLSIRAEISETKARPRAGGVEGASSLSLLGYRNSISGTVAGETQTPPSKETPFQL